MSMITKAQRQDMAAQLLDLYDKERVVLKHWLEHVASDDDVDALHARQVMAPDNPSRGRISERASRASDRYRRYLESTLK